MIKALRKLTSIIEHSLWQDIFVGGKPRSVASNAMVKQLCRLAPDLQFIIDGGANHGQFSRACSRRYPDAAIIAFEPAATTAAICRDNLADLTKFELVEMALGKIDGQLDFFESSNSQNSSLLKTIPGNSLLGDATIVRNHVVDVCRIDTFLAGRIVPHRSLLKLDLQGFEMPALVGAGDRLRDFRYVLLECPLMKAYEGESTFGDLTVMLTNAGYELVGLLNVAAREGTVVQVDALFDRGEGV